MNEIRFTRRERWCVPSYGDYFIQERLEGKDIYGHDAWGYALFRKIHFQLIAEFKTRKKAYQFVGKETGLSLFDMKMGSYAFIVNDRDILGIQRNGKLYRIEKRLSPVQVLVRPEQDEQLTPWYTTYNECLLAAKEYIKQEENRL